LAKLQKKESESFNLIGHTDANQTELERLRSENAALGTQCRRLADQAEDACKRAEEARRRFEQAELAARRREAECDASGFVEATSEPFEAGTFGRAANPQIRGPTFPEGPTGICASTPGTPAPDVALNASLPLNGDHTLTVVESATHSLADSLPVRTAEFGRPSPTILTHNMSADAVSLNSPVVEAPREFVDPVPKGLAESVPVHGASVTGLAAAIAAAAPAPPVPPTLTSPVVHLRADVASPQATFTPPPQSAMRMVRCAGVSVQPASSMSMQMLASNTPCGLAVGGCITYQCT